MGCTDRQIGCHGSCEKYKEWQDWYHAQQKHLDEQKSRWCRPWSHGIERKTRSYLKYGSGTMKGGDQ